MGLLVMDEDPAGGSKTLTRSEEPGGYGVTVTTALGRSTTYHVQTLATGLPQRTVARPNGLAGTSVGGAGSAVTTTLPDGRVLSWSPGPDPRFGMLSPFVKTEVLTTPGGKTLSIARSRAATLLDPTDAMSFTTTTDTTTVNGKSFLEVFAKAPRTLTRTTPAGRHVTTTLDNKGRVVKMEVPGVLPVDLAYDAYGRLESATQGPRTLTRGYGSGGFLANITDPLGQMATFGVDAIGRVLSETRPDGEETLYGYDATGNRTSVTPPERPDHVFGYTPVDLQESYEPPDLLTGPAPTSWTYDLDRKPELMTKAGGVDVGFGYDNAGRQTSVTFPGGVITRGYDPTTGKLATVTGPAGVAVSYGYDGHLLTDVTWTGAVAGMLHRVYNNDLRVTSETVNGGGAVSFGHDDDGLLTGAGGLTLSRDAQNGRVTGTSIGIVAEVLGYDAFGAVENRSVTVGGAGLLSTTYVRDALGRIIARTETIQGETHTDGYVYDAAGRLTDVYRDGLLAAHHELDDNGNRLSRTTPGGTASGSYDDQDRLTAYGGMTYAYLDSGELLSRMDTATGETTLFTYDALGNLRQVTLPGGTVIEYVVDGLGRRVGKKVGGTLVKGWLYGDALRPVAELDGAGAIVARFVYAEGVNVPDLMIKGGVTYRIVTDTIGSVRLVVDAVSGAVVQRLDYDEHGRVLLDTSPGFQPFGFAGGLYDPDTGLVRFGARDYDPEVGRWTAKDPLLFDGGDTNLYAYAVNDPVNNQDPRGEETLEPGICKAFARFLPGCVCGGTCPNPLPGGAPPGWAPPPPDPSPGIGICRENPDEDERQRCKRVKQQCITYCSDSTLPTRNFGWSFRRCKNECLEAAGCPRDS